MTDTAAASDAQPALESLLLQAQADPAARELFYATLLESEVFAVVYDFGDSPADLPEGTVVFATLTLDDVVWVPFATSAEIFESQFSGRTAVRLSGFDLFNNASPKNFLMNPGTEYVKSFSAEEIGYVLAEHQRRAGGAMTLQVAPGTRLTLGEPAERPTKLIDRLCSHFAKQPAVRRAWIAQSQMQQTGASSNLLLGVEIDGDINAVMQPLGAVVSPLLPRGTAFDMMVVEPGKADGLGGYFLNESQPFYDAGVAPKAAEKKGFRRFLGL